MILFDLGLYYLKMIRWIATYPSSRAWQTCKDISGLISPGFSLTALLDALLPERLGIFMTEGFFRGWV